MNSIELQKFTSLLGEIVWLMKKSHKHQFLFINELEWLIMSPILKNQFHIFRDKGELVGFVCWANVNTEVDERLKTGFVKLMDREWNCGSILWLIDAIASKEYLPQMYKFLKEQILVDREINAFLKKEDGNFAHGLL